VRYLLFAGYSYYAGGGATDLVQSSDDHDWLVHSGLALEGAGDHDWWHIWDVEEEKITAGKQGAYCGTYDDD